MLIRECRHSPPGACALLPRSSDLVDARGGALERARRRRDTASHSGSRAPGRRGRPSRRRRSARSGSGSRGRRRAPSARAGRGALRNAARVAERGVVEALAAGERLVARGARASRPGSPRSSRRRARPRRRRRAAARSPRDVAPRERELCGLERAAEARVHAELERQARELEPEPPASARPSGVSGDRNARIAVHATLQVERRMRVAGQHEEAHGPRLRDLGCKGSA